MADKNTRVGRERLGRPVDELVTGRAPGTGDRPGDYTATELAGQTPGATPGGTSRPTRSTPQDEAARDVKPEKRTRELRAEIEQTREDMSETVNAIQDRLRPGNIAANAAESIRETASETTRDLVESEPVMYVRANPIPAAMIGIGIAGLAWLAFGGRDADDARRSRGRGYRGRGYASGYGSRGEQYLRPDGSRGLYERQDRQDYGAYGVYDRDTGTGEGISERVSDVADDVRDRASQVTNRARRQAARAQSSLERTWNENPLLIGAASALVGALVGVAVPETDVENEWMGEYRDDMVEGVQQTVREKVEDVQQTVREKVEDVQHAATDAANQVKEAVGIKDEG
jgi:hypothetical protein